MVLIDWEKCNYHSLLNNVISKKQKIKNKYRENGTKTNEFHLPEKSETKLTAVESTNQLITFDPFAHLFFMLLFFGWHLCAPDMKMKRQRKKNKNAIYVETGLLSSSFCIRIEFYCFAAHNRRIYTILVIIRSARTSRLFISLPSTSFSSSASASHSTLHLAVVIFYEHLLIMCHVNLARMHISVRGSKRPIFKSSEKL